MIKVNEIFTSIDGEVNRFGQGCFTTFLRLQGCNLQCSYCDTWYAQGDRGAKDMDIKEIISQVKTPKVTITGGEPLMQTKECEELIKVFLDLGLFVTVETNGSYPITKAYRYYGDQLGWVIDFKFEYEEKMIWKNFINRTRGDWIKFVLDRKEDYETSLGIIDRLKRVNCQARIAMGFTGSIKPAEIVKNLIRDERWEVSLNVQLHKCINIK